MGTHDCRKIPNRHPDFFRTASRNRGKLRLTADGNDQVRPVVEVVAQDLPEVSVAATHILTSSTRRFLARPFSVLLSAIG